ncbi:MAG: CdaR family protein [Candidatus Aminicenantales bacterium]
MKRQIKNLFVRNWALKLLSLILAATLWLTLIPEEKISSEKTLNIPLETHNIPSDMELVVKPVSTIDVTIRAPNRLINQISPTNVRAILNLEKATVNQEDYPLNPDMISVPSGAEVIKVLPNKVNLKLEKTKEVRMEIEPTLIGKLPETFTINKIEVIPANVSVKGPESRIKIKDKVRTSPIDISALTQSTEYEVDLILPKPDLRLATSQTKAKVRIILSEKKSN